MQSRKSTFGRKHQFRQNCPAVAPPPVQASPPVPQLPPMPMPNIANIVGGFRLPF